MSSNLYGNMDVLNVALNGNSARYESISKSLANVNTPEFKKSTVDFESELQNVISNKNTKVALNKTNEKHMGKGNQTLETFQPSIDVQSDTSTRRDENNVNPDIEMMNLAKTTVMYNALTDQINRKFTKIQSVITEGGK